MKRTLFLMLAAGLVALTGCKEEGGPTKIPVDSVKVTPSSISIGLGSTTTLVATVTPEEATSAEVTWTSDDPAIAEVDEDGVVTPVAIGKVRINATADGKEDHCTVTVVNPVAVTGITLNADQLSLIIGGTGKLVATIAPDDATNKTVTWSSNNSSVATVDNDGLVTGMAEGSSVIYAAAGTYTAMCNVIVSSGSVPKPLVKDFYYSDGTWSSILDDSKTPVGIIFSTNYDRSTSSSDYAKPDDSNPDIVCLVVSLDETSGVWDTGAAANGAGRTKTLVYSLRNGEHVTYDDTVISGSINTFPPFAFATGKADVDGNRWYIPSLYELRELILVMNNQTADFNMSTTASSAAFKSFNNIIKAAGGTPVAGPPGDWNSYIYWTSSSSEAWFTTGDGTSALAIYSSGTFENGARNAVYKNWPLQIRATLSFKY